MPKGIRRPNSRIGAHKGPKPGFGFRISGFFRISDFGIRISSLTSPNDTPPNALASPPAILALQPGTAAIGRPGTGDGMDSPTEDGSATARPPAKQFAAVWNQGPRPARRK